MSTYTLLANGMVRKGDDTYIPADEGNADYREFLAWQGDGNVAEREAEPDLPGLPPAANLDDLLRRLEALEQRVAAMTVEQG